MEVEGPIKTFILRGIRDSPPYLHDGRLLTLEDTVASFNLVLGWKLNQREKQALVTFMRQFTFSRPWKREGKMLTPMT